MTEKRIIFHVDLDAFFASCEERENPRFLGKPIVVGADPKEGKGRGVVSTANYTARKFGIHSAMPISRAWRLCASASSAGAPSAIFLPVNSSLYSRVSKSVMKILQDTAQKYDGTFEQVGIDEAFLDITNIRETLVPYTHDRTYMVQGVERSVYRKAADIAKGIKEKICKQEKVTASVGVGPNMLIAKIASDFQKPNGVTIVNPEDVQAFLDPLPVRKIPGVGPKTEAALKQLRVETVLDLRKVPQLILYEKFGKHGIALYESSRGIDERPVGEDAETKSISEEHTFDHDTKSAQKILPVLFRLTQNVLQSALKEEFRAFHTVTIKIRYADFQTHTKSQSGNYQTKNQEAVERLALKLFWPFLNAQKKIRLIGFRVSNFI